MPNGENKSILYRAFRFYVDGFKNMSSWGKNLWIIILIKLFILFVVIRLLFMPDFLKRNFRTDEDRGRHVMEELTR